MRETIFREAMAVACLDSMYVISYNFFFSIFLCGKDVFGFPENCLGKEKFCFWIWKWKPSWNTEMFDGWVFFIFFYGKDWVEFGYIVFGLNGIQWVFS